MRKNNFFVLLIIFFYFLSIPVFAEEDSPNIETEESSSEMTSPPETNKETNFDFDLGINLGVDTFDPSSGSDSSETYQLISIKPEFKIGKFGIAFDLELHYRFTSNTDQIIEIREEDWVPTDSSDFLALYLPKISYISWGDKGDTLFARLGEIDSATLGTGFLVDSYTNTLFLPDEKVIGLVFDMDANFFNFPYLGLESMAGNIAHFDVTSLRLYGTPFKWSKVPTLKYLEFGFTTALDLDPDYREDYYITDNNSGAEASPVVIFGLDLVQPILNNRIISMAAFGDMAFQNSHMGGDIGLGGRILAIVPYMLKLRILGDNFVPSYFDYTYDLYRGQKYDIYNTSDGTVALEGGLGWVASTGICVFNDLLKFTITMDGPFKSIPEGSIEDNSYLEYPHLYSEFVVAEDLIPYLYFSASFDKKYITEIADIVSAENSIIDFSFNFITGAAVISLSYDMIYDDDGVDGVSWTDFNIDTSLNCSLKLF
ncbi:MAG: hypothetical protein PQJ46_10735 [Spirochaetales bacterium]|nr:hypothetical protein [Spirochaetales bacterium]